MSSDPLNDLFNSAAASTPVVRPESPASYQPQTFTERCRKCNGTGNWRPGYPCFGCKGRGTKNYRTSPEQRARNVANASNRRTRNEADNLAQFKTEFPEIWAWMENNSWAFAQSMVEAVKRFGYLTDRQMEVCRNSIARDAAYRARREVEARPVAVANATINVERLSQALSTAGRNGLKKPALTIGGLTFSLATAVARYPGAIYVTSDEGVYLGRIQTGEFHPARAAQGDTNLVGRIVAAVVDPARSAVEHGRLTGRCSCCRRTLTDPVSVANGIGPICASRFGW